jgi:hypothetical protein
MGFLGVGEVFSKSRSQRLRVSVREALAYE